MKPNKTVFRKGTFEDYAGVKRPYVFAAVSTQLSSEEVSIEGAPFPLKAVGVGFSIVHPSDLNRTKKKTVKGVEIEVPVYDEKIGEQIAVGKAVASNNLHVLYTAAQGMINTKVVQALLEQEEAHFLTNPKDYIANYERDRVRHNYAKLGGNKLDEQVSAKAKELRDLFVKQDQTYADSLKHS
jgi:hypothetical protein